MGNQCSSHRTLGDDSEGCSDPLKHKDDLITDLQGQLKAMEEQVSTLDKAMQKERGLKKELQGMLAELDTHFVIIGRRDVLEDPYVGPPLPPDEELTVLLFGMTGCGKSSLGNLIIGENVFQASDDTSSVTRLDSLMKYEAEDGSLTLLDTIGMGDTELTQEQVAKSIRDVALQAPKGIDVLCFVMKNERLTDDAIARFIYITQFCWGEGCLPNLYIIVTHASRYATDQAEAHDWIDRNVEINWRFKHLFEIVGQDHNRFIFIDNPDVYSMEPNIPERQRASRRSMMTILASHSRNVVPPFTNAMMEKAVEMGKKSVPHDLVKKKEKEIADLKKKLELVQSGKSVEKDTEKLKVLQRESEELEQELAKARKQKVEQKKIDSIALLSAAKGDENFNNEVEKEAEKATRKFIVKFRPNSKAAKQVITGSKDAVVKGAMASAAAVEDVAKVCWRLASNFKLPTRSKSKDIKKKEEEKTKEGPDSWISPEVLHAVQNVDPKVRQKLLESKQKDLEA